MFGRWGIPPGPYLMVPFLGPSDPRDLVGTLFDTALSPLTWLVPGSSVPNIVNARARADDKIEAARNSSLDYYVFVRDAYVQYRAAAIANESSLSDYDAGAYFESGRGDLYEVPAEEDEADAPK
jgi:phospholipid-binding lipoprotein MlaA